MISIRLSPEEYESLRTVYTARGIRNVSEFARFAMKRILETSPQVQTQPADLEHQVRVLDTKVATLQGELTQLSRIVTDTLKK